MKQKWEIVTIRSHYETSSPTFHVEHFWLSAKCSTWNTRLRVGKIPCQSRLVLEIRRLDYSLASEERVGRVRLQEAPRQPRLRILLTRHRACDPPPSQSVPRGTFVLRTTPAIPRFTSVFHVEHFRACTEIRHCFRTGDVIILSHNREHYRVALPCERHPAGN